MKSMIKSAAVKVAYLVLAHKDPLQLLRLIKALKAPNVSFIIHIDLNVNLDIFIEYLADEESVSFLEERSVTGWGSFGIVEACITGLRHTSENLNIDRVVLLSGQDYPIKEKEYIYSYFANNPSAIFIQYFKLPYSKWFQGGWGRFPSRSSDIGVKQLYAGSQWWSFPIDTIKFILYFLNEKPAFTSYFKKVLIPDESFFQTLLLNFGGEEILGRLVNCGLKLIKWDKPYIHPRILTMKDKNIVFKDKSLFARKFDSIKSEELMSFIDSHILGEDHRYETDSGNGKKKQVILFLTNKCDLNTLNRYKSFKLQCEFYGKTELAFHKTACSIETKEMEDLLPYIFDNSILEDLGYIPIFDSLLPGSNHFPLLKYYRENPDFDYYWLVEDDVIYIPGWDKFFSFFNMEERKEDFLTSHVKDNIEQPKWYWWHTLEYKQKKIPDNIKLRSFNPIYRISNSALEFIHHCLSNGWSGHHEVLLPTLIKKGGFVISDFGGDGRYVAENQINRFYDGGSNNFLGDILTGTMRFRPAINETEMTSPLLYHPVKELTV